MHLKEGKLYRFRGAFHSVVHSSPLVARIMLVKVSGNNDGIGRFLGSYISRLLTQNHGLRGCEIGLLARSNSTLKSVSSTINVEHKVFFDTSLDLDSSEEALVLRTVIHFVANELKNPYQLVTEIYGCEFNADAFPMQRIKDLLQASAVSLADNEERIILIAEIIVKEKISSKLRQILSVILNDAVLYDSYKEPNDEQIQLMTLHKSKGLEFKIVFHLDLYDYILPSYQALNGDKNALEQDANLHYVGITRAKQFCVFVVGSERTNSNGEIHPSKISRFLTPQYLTSQMRVCDEHSLPIFNIG